jgi:transcriptional antiterminator NusG
MSQENSNETEAKWYVAHTYSGYENKVKDTLERAVENRKMQDIIQEIVVPMEERIEIKDGKKKTTLGKVFPGYVLVKMILTEESWYVVRNVRGVTGFVGAGGKPEPLTESEIRKMGFDTAPVEVDYVEGDTVKIVSGPLESFVGVVESINTEKAKVKVLVSMFGRETPVELDFAQVEKM